jgi:hypothetical protein
LAEKVYSPKDMQALGLKFEAPVLNGTFQQRKKCPFPCDSVTGRFHPARSCSGVHTEWTWEKQALLFNTYLNRQYERTRRANFNPSLGM